MSQLVTYTDVNTLVVDVWYTKKYWQILFLQPSLLHSNMELQTPVQEQGVVSWLMVTFSLIPSPFLPPVLVCKTKRECLGNFVPPVLDCLQYAKQRGGRPGKFCHVHCDVICRHMRAVSNEEPLGPSCYILSKCLRPESSKCLVDLKLINT